MLRAGATSRQQRAPARKDVAPLGGPRSALNDAALAASKLPLPVLIMILTILIPVEFRIGSLALTGLRVELIIMIIPLLYGLFSGRFGPILMVDWLFLGHFGWIVVALAVNNPDRMVQQAGSLGVEFLGGYLMGRAYIRSREAFAALSKVLIWSIVLMVPLFLYEAKTDYTVIPMLLEKLPGISSVNISRPDPRMGLNRVQASFDHPIHFGLYASVVFSLAFVAFEGIRSLAWRIVMSVIVVGSGALALSSGALLALVLQIGLISWSLMFQKIQWRWWLLLGLFVLAYIVIDLLSNRTPIKVFMSYATFSAHTAYWRGIIFEWGMKNVWANPIFGLGLRDWIRPSYMRSGSMDNFWLVMAVRYGIPGFLLIATGYVLGLAQIMRRNFDADPRLMWFRRAWVFTFLGLTFTLCTVHIWGSIYSFVFFMFGSGIWLIKEGAPDPHAVGRRNKRETPVQSETDISVPEASVASSYTRFGQGHHRRDRL